jgi:predicted Fe-S protein YdhL (DUF1289 family)
MSEFFCTGCNRHRAVELLASVGAGGRKKVCSICAQKAEARRENKEIAGLNGLREQHVTDGKARRHAKRYKAGFVPDFCKD